MEQERAVFLAYFLKKNCLKHFRDLATFCVAEFQDGIQAKGTGSHFTASLSVCACVCMCIHFNILFAELK